MQSHTASQVQVGKPGVKQDLAAMRWAPPPPFEPSPGTDPEVGGGKAVGGRHVGGGGGVRIVGVDVGEQGAHDGWHTGAHVLGGEAGKVAGERSGRHWDGAKMGGGPPRCLQRATANGTPRPSNQLPSFCPF